VNDTIELRDIRCSVIVGVLPEERVREQPITFDIDFVRNFATAALNDDINATTNYARVISLAIDVARQGKFQLLETLAYRVAQAVLDFDVEVDTVHVAVRKLRPPVPEDVATVGVRCTVQR
jgi:dihydroneopterin aldolase